MAQSGTSSVQHPSGIYHFGTFTLDVAQRRLSRGEEQIQLRMKAFDTLRLLVENAGHLLTKRELMTALWADAAVEENSLTQNISTLRKALGHNADGQPYIETVPKIGYRFALPVTVASRARSRQAP